ncbi:MAG: aminotransferase class V-fold PLP-dependent enzyme, partial [Clostridia bacterium]|nr:aminotransferase class V-fold PLP-dependent enzyme [Clostridia bacterium]
MIYFDNAATTWPKPSAVFDAARRAVEEYGGNPGRSSHALSLAAAERVDEVRR